MQKAVACGVQQPQLMPPSHIGRLCCSIFGTCKVPQKRCQSGLIFQLCIEAEQIDAKVLALPRLH